MAEYLKLTCDLGVIFGINLYIVQQQGKLGDWVDAQLFTFQIVLIRNVSFKIGDECPEKQGFAGFRALKILPLNSKSETE